MYRCLSRIAPEGQAAFVEASDTARIPRLVR